jgi:hypothetical protein
MDKIKLVWEFRGPGAKETAEHHAVHLKEFNQRNEMADHPCGTEEVNDSYSIAYMIVPKSEMIFYRDQLRPQRAFMAE